MNSPLRTFLDITVSYQEKNAESMRRGFAAIRLKQGEKKRDGKRPGDESRRPEEGDAA